MCLSTHYFPVGLQQKAAIMGFTIMIVWEKRVEETQSKTTIKVILETTYIKDV